VEEFGRLDVYIKAFAYNKDGHERMRMEIHSWYDGSALIKIPRRERELHRACGRTIV
jgi:hypothetical protein